MPEGDAGGAGALGGEGDAGAAGPFGDLQGEALGYVQNKGWKTIADAVSSYQNLETLQRTPENQLLRLPEDLNNAEAMAEVHKRLGRPDASDGYDFGEYETPEGSIDLRPEYRTAAHELGLSQHQLMGLFEWFNGRMDGLSTEADEAASIQTERDVQDLKREWGAEYQPNIDAGKRFAARFGLDQDALAEMEHGMGTKKFLILAAAVGRGLGEHPAPQGTETVGALSMTPEAALAAITELRGDEAFQKRYQAGDQAAGIKMRDLFALAYPD